MKDMLDDIPDDELRKKLQDYSESPDDTLWDNIAGQMKERMALNERLRTYTEQPDESLWASIKNGVAVERSLLWIERTGQIAAAVALCLLLYPFIEVPHATEQISSSAASEVFEKPKPAAQQPLNDKPQLDWDAHFKNSQHLKKLEGNAENSSPSQIFPESNRGLDTPVKHSNFAKSETDGFQINNCRGEEIKTIQEELNPTEVSKDISTNKDEDLVQNHDSLDAEVVIPPSLVKAKKKQSGEKKSDKQKKSKKRRHGVFYALAMPTFGYQQISPVKDDNILIESIEKVSAFSSKRLGIRAETGIEKPLSKKFSYHVGLLYYQRKQTINYVFKNAGDVKVENVSQNVYQVTLPTDTAKFEYELKNVGVLVGLNYTTKMHRFTSKVGIAVELQKSLSRPDNEVDNGQQYFVFGDVYYRISYPVSRRLEIMFQPTFNYALQLDSRINAPFYVKPYGLGLNFGGYFHF